MARQGLSRAVSHLQASFFYQVTERGERLRVKENKPEKMVAVADEVEGKEKGGDTGRDRRKYVPFYSSFSRKAQVVQGNGKGGDKNLHFLSPQAISRGNVAFRTLFLSFHLFPHSDILQVSLSFAPESSFVVECFLFLKEKEHLRARVKDGWYTPLPPLWLVNSCIQPPPPFFYLTRCREYCSSGMRCH